MKKKGYKINHKINCMPRGEGYNWKTETETQRGWQREHCHKHFWRSTRDLLDDNQASHMEPEFSEKQARDFFKTVCLSLSYHQHHLIKIPLWLMRLCEWSNNQLQHLIHLHLIWCHTRSSKGAHPSLILSWISSSYAGPRANLLEVCCYQADWEEFCHRRSYRISVQLP